MKAHTHLSLLAERLVIVQVYQGKICHGAFRDLRNQGVRTPYRRAARNVHLLARRPLPTLEIVRCIAQVLHGSFVFGRIAPERRYR